MGEGGRQFDACHGERVPQASEQYPLAIAIPTDDSNFYFCAAEASAQRQTSTSQPAMSAQRGAKSAGRRAGKFRIQLRKRPAQKKPAQGPAQKKRK
ncbi:hypothetical protein RHMOL_Rhmol05G0142900 [Rhododendron molle]|uniref:Uncharacterized protein n=1 Tax=Rhododendron molle TaxID=49168 RepID=A0ACC0NQ68_RHOML|nr:hypothetical protein RHMOL_Rhmol05G0142900 [Rhododendron molle]